MADALWGVEGPSWGGAVGLSGREGRSPPLRPLGDRTVSRAFGSLLMWAPM
jgi:hypothetical protein